MTVAAVQVAEGLRQVDAELLLAVGHLARGQGAVLAGPRTPARPHPCGPWGYVWGEEHRGAPSLELGPSPPARPPSPWQRVPAPRAPHQAGPEEVAGAEAPLPGQRAEEGVPQPPPEQHGAAVEGKLGLLRG